MDDIGEANTAFVAEYTNLKLHDVGISFSSIR